MKATWAFFLQLYQYFPIHHSLSQAKQAEAYFHEPGLCIMESPIHQSEVVAKILQLAH